MAACIFGRGTDFPVHQLLKAAKETPNFSASFVWVIPRAFLIISSFWRVVIQSILPTQLNKLYKVSQNWVNYIKLRPNLLEIRMNKSKTDHFATVGSTWLRIVEDVRTAVALSDNYIHIPALLRCQS